MSTTSGAAAPARSAAWSCRCRTDGYRCASHKAVDIGRGNSYRTRCNTRDEAVAVN
jgi:hypothetical protein